MFVRWQKRTNRKGEEILYAALCSGAWVEGKTKPFYLGALGNIAVGDIRFKGHREIFWRVTQARLVDLGLEKEQLVKVEEALAQRVPRPGDKQLIQHSSGNNEWYTPPQWVTLARNVMGGIDLDPASSDAAQTRIQAATYYTIQDDGLSKHWFGRVWLNPPYSKMRPWVSKAIASYDAKDVTEAILLVRPAVGASWYSTLTARFCRAEPLGRIKFVGKDGSQQPKPVHGNTFFYLGGKPDRFSDLFKTGGCVISRPA